VVPTNVNVNAKNLTSSCWPTIVTRVRRQMELVMKNHRDCYDAVDDGTKHDDEDNEMC
jgi:hypothetical protein